MISGHSRGSMIALLLLASLAAIRQARGEGLSERTASYRKQAAESTDPVAFWIATAEKDNEEEVRGLVVGELSTHPDDPRAIAALERLSVMPPEERGRKDPPSYPSQAKSNLQVIFANKEWQQLEKSFPKPADLVAPAKAAFLKTKNEVLKQYVRKFLDAQGDEDSIMFLVKEDLGAFDEALCTAIAARIKEGNKDLYKMCQGFLRDNKGPVKGSDRKETIRRLWIGVTVMMHTKRMDALDDLLGLFALDDDLLSSSLSGRLPEAVVAYGDQALPKLDTYLQEEHPREATTEAWVAVMKIGGREAVQILEREKAKYSSDENKRRDLEQCIERTKDKNR